LLLLLCVFFRDPPLDSLFTSLSFEFLKCARSLAYCDSFFRSPLVPPPNCRFYRSFGFWFFLFPCSFAGNAPTVLSATMLPDRVCSLSVPPPSFCRRVLRALPQQFFLVSVLWYTQLMIGPVSPLKNVVFPGRCLQVLPPPLKFMYLPLPGCWFTFITVLSTLFPPCRPLPPGLLCTSGLPLYPPPAFALVCFSPPWFPCLVG